MNISIRENDTNPTLTNGMSLRDYLAGKAMEGLVAKYGSGFDTAAAYEIADAMLACRKKLFQRQEKKAPKDKLMQSIDSMARR